MSNRRNNRELSSNSNFTPRAAQTLTPNARSTIDLFFSIGRSLATSLATTAYQALAPAQQLTAPATQELPQTQVIKAPINVIVMASRNLWYGILGTDLVEADMSATQKQQNGQAFAAILECLADKDLVRIEGETLAKRIKTTSTPFEEFAMQIRSLARRINAVAKTIAKGLATAADTWYEARIITQILSGLGAEPSTSVLSLPGTPKQRASGPRQPDASIGTTRHSHGLSSPPAGTDTSKHIESADWTLCACSSEIEVETITARRILVVVTTVASKVT